ncbi:MAG: CBS domain-containing protein [Actinobacteria bacterium]|jgi:dTDP-glucose pyrophosphorylase|nr:CBS domain-containing protein [Actinomycetota bacterium]
MEWWRRTIISTTATIKDVVKNLSETGAQISLVVEPDSLNLVGVVTDGDVRKGLLAGHSLDSSVSTIINAKPRVGRHDESPEIHRQIMRAAGIRHLPLVRGHQVVGLARLDELGAAPLRENTVVIMAGGRGERLRPLTDLTPKPMIAVGGRPILETIISQFLEQGFRTIYLAINYLGDSIREHFGDGTSIGASIEYLAEDRPLGTAGALSLMQMKPESPLIVMNGDLLTRLNFAALVDFHQSHAADLTVVVRDDEFQVPYGVVATEGENIVAIEEKPVKRVRVNAGIYVLSPSALELVPRDEYLDMPQLVDLVIGRRRRVVAFPLHEYWIDIGRSEQLSRAEQDWTQYKS